MADYSSYRQQVLAAAQALVERGLLSATGGNVSLRIDGEDAVAVTPSSKDYTQMQAGDICICDFNRKIIEGQFNPSVETGMHIAVYKSRPDVGAVVHTHQPAASVFALLGMPIPALFDEQTLNLGREAAVVAYGLSGSTDLLKNIEAAVANNCNAYILQNHGALIFATDIEQAVRNASILEKTAQVYHSALLLSKDIPLLPKQTLDMLGMLLEGKQKGEIMRRKKLAEKAAAEG